MSTLTDFMKQIGTDASLLEAYKNNPEAVMRAHGLSDDEINAVMSGDIEALKQLTGNEDYQAYVLIHHGND